VLNAAPATDGVGTDRAELGVDGGDVGAEGGDHRLPERPGWRGLGLGTAIGRYLIEPEQVLVDPEPHGAHIGPEPLDEPLDVVGHEIRLVLLECRLHLRHDLREIQPHVVAPSLADRIVIFAPVSRAPG